MARDARLDSDQLGLVCGFYRHGLGADARHCAFSSGSAQHVAECPDRVLADNRDFLCFLTFWPAGFAWWSLLNLNVLLLDAIMLLFSILIWLLASIL